MGRFVVRVRTALPYANPWPTLGRMPPAPVPPSSLPRRPGWARLLLRGVLKQCPRCGGGRNYRGWFHMVERCGTCGLRFEREPGFFVGAYLINFAVTIILLFIISMGFVAMKAVDENASATGPMVIGIAVAVIVPPLFYPWARTLWSAIDIGMTPIEDHEVADADEALARGDVGRRATPRPKP